MQKQWSLWQSWKSKQQNLHGNYLQNSIHFKKLSSELCRFVKKDLSVWCDINCIYTDDKRLQFFNKLMWLRYIYNYNDNRNFVKEDTGMTGNALGS